MIAEIMFIDIQMSPMIVLLNMVNNNQLKGEEIVFINITVTGKADVCKELENMWF